MTLDLLWSPKLPHRSICSQCIPRKNVRRLALYDDLLSKRTADKLRYALWGGKAEASLSSDTDAGDEILSIAIELCSIALIGNSSLLIFSVWRSQLKACFRIEALPLNWIAKDPKFIFSTIKSSALRLRLGTLEFKQLRCSIARVFCFGILQILDRLSYWFKLGLNLWVRSC